MKDSIKNLRNLLSVETDEMVDLVSFTIATHCFQSIKISNPEHLTSNIYKTRVMEMLYGLCEYAVIDKDRTFSYVRKLVEVHNNPFDFTTGDFKYASTFNLKIHSDSLEKTFNENKGLFKNLGASLRRVGVSYDNED